jgi:hypothetical protein
LLPFPRVDTRDIQSTSSKEDANETDRCNDGNTFEIPNIKDMKFSNIPCFISLEGSSTKTSIHFYSVYLNSLMLHISKMDELQDPDMASKRLRKWKEYVIELDLD